jgi:hypothetical protein
VIPRARLDPGLKVEIDKLIRRIRVHATRDEFFRRHLAEQVQLRETEERARRIRRGVAETEQRFGEGGLVGARTHLGRLASPRGGGGS